MKNNMQITGMAGTLSATDHFGVLSNNMAHIIRDPVK